MDAVRFHTDFFIYRAPFPASESVNFEPHLSANVIPRDGRQSVLGCLKGCTRELRVGWCWDYIIHNAEGLVGKRIM